MCSSTARAIAWPASVWVVEAPVLLVLLLSVLVGCSDDGPAGTRPDYEPIAVDVHAEAANFNGGNVYEFVVDERGFVSAPTSLPAGEVMLTLTYDGASPAPHSLVLDGLNADQPVVAVDLPGSNNGSVVVPAGHRVFFDGAPGNRQDGYEGHLEIVGDEEAVTPVEAEATVAWEAEGLAFTSVPHGFSPADAPVALELTVRDALPHSIAFEQVRGDQPLVAVDGPGSNRRNMTLPPGTYIYFCAVPGHREAGMEGLVTFG